MLVFRPDPGRVRLSRWAAPRPYSAPLGPASVPMHPPLLGLFGPLSVRDSCAPVRRHPCLSLLIDHSISLFSDMVSTTVER